MAAARLAAAVSSNADNTRFPDPRSGRRQQRNSRKTIAASTAYGMKRFADQLAAVFYTNLFADTRQSDITLLNIFESIENNYTAAVHFKYHWILSDGTPTHFECMDIFKFDEQGKIADMTIIYDTAKLRPAFEALSK